MPRNPPSKQRWKRIAAVVAGILCLLLFFSTRVNITITGDLSHPTRSSTWEVGVEGSPWITHDENVKFPDGSLHSSTHYYLLSWSWLVLAAALLLLKSRPRVSAPAPEGEVGLP